ncbi:hypothetical protein C1646_755089 [Rhizophagus diaphanus]|nr:hypothetical protein C1646_755089 [Rhizophagus diaphanus] [Rhizophagus sp. MUCL 43196]
MVRANIMVRKTRSNKKDIICKRCDHEYSTLQKFHEHLKRKNPCNPLQKQKEAESSNINRSNKEKPHVVIPIPVPEKEAPKELDLGVEPFEANDLDGYLTLFHDLELNDPEAVRLPTLKELKKYKKISEPKADLGPKTQAHRKDNLRI